jgi:hypothetical protein
MNWNSSESMLHAPTIPDTGHRLNLGQSHVNA